MPRPSLILRLQAVTTLITDFQIAYFKNIIITARTAADTGEGNQYFHRRLSFRPTKRVGDGGG